MFCKYITEISFSLIRDNKEIFSIYFYLNFDAENKFSFLKDDKISNLTPVLAPQDKYHCNRLFNA